LTGMQQKTRSERVFYWLLIDAGFRAA